MLFDILVEESKFEEAEKCLKHLLDAHKNWSGLAEKKRNDIEIDFLIGTGNKLRQKIIPIEVKFGRNYLYPCLYGYVLVVFFFLIFLLVILINPIFLLNCIYCSFEAHHDSRGFLQVD